MRWRRAGKAASASRACADWCRATSQLRYRGVDQYGAPIDRTVGGFHARVVQHECDHLDGILYPMRIRDMRNFGFHDVLFPDQPATDD